MDPSWQYLSLHSEVGLLLSARGDGIYYTIKIINVLHISRLTVVSHEAKKKQAVRDE